MLAPVWQVLNEIDQSFDHAGIGVCNVFNAGSAEIYLEFETMKRVRPGMHLGIDEIVCVASPDAGNMRVMIDEPPGIDVFIGVLHEIGGLRTQAVLEIFRLITRRAAKAMD